MPGGINLRKGAVTNLAEGVIYGDPLFVSTKADFAPLWHRVNDGGTIYTAIQQAAGTERALAGLDVHLRKHSPAIDAGDPAVKCTEPKPNGHRVNMGFYGNTPGATMSPGGTLLLVR